MKLRIFLEPQQGASYLAQLRVAQAAEHYGFDAVFRSDHYLRMGEGSGEPGPTDAWITLGALARETSSIRLGTLLTAATFRYPGPLAIAVAQVDEMSSGRVELGLGAGWYTEEHRAYGIPFPPMPERFKRLEEQLSIIRGLWTSPLGEQFDFTGEFYQLHDSPALPKPRQQPHPPIIVGGLGPTRTPMLAARFADEFNVPFANVDTVAELGGRADDACRSIDRDPTSLLRSVALVVCAGESAEEVSHRASRIGRDVDELRQNGLAGEPSEVIAQIEAYRAVGVERIYLQLLDMSDLAQLELIGRSILPQVSQ
ncbi:MAG: LLM class F420-dependent oxidoreductase [Acidimicrobiales bacterium]